MILEIISQSYPKHNQKTFAVLFKELQDEFQTTGMSLRAFMVRMTKLKADAYQMVNIQHIYQHAVSAKVRRDGADYTSSIVDKYLDHL